LPSDEAYNLAHPWTIGALCIAAKSSRLCRFRVKTRSRPFPAYVSFRQLRTRRSMSLCEGCPGADICATANKAVLLVLVIALAQARAIYGSARPLGPLDQECARRRAVRLELEQNNRQSAINAALSNK
jgi:hypothetical protein